MSEELYLLLLPEEGKTKKYKIKYCYLKWLLLIFISLCVFSAIGFWALWNNITLRQEVKNLKSEVIALQKKNDDLLFRISELEKEKHELLANAVGKLKNHSQMLRDLVADLGLSKYVKSAQNKAFKGGPYKPEGGIFVPLQEKATPEILLNTYEYLLSDIEAYLKVLSKVPIGKPCRGYISSRYGRRKDPFTGKPAFHTGIDIVSYPGTPIRATADGKVIYAGNHSGYGKVVVIRHGFGYSTLYGHLKKIKVRAGQKVKRGQVIGYLGNTGRSTGPHLHYEIRRYGRYLNPSKYLRLQLAKK
ncbi:M23 family metallopeptidase [Thermosulfurimonas dismutans]|uniref:Putative peptidase n=1 Tax=Thermosulfurimonas dismutans TaxID=999894 RepID=A0A179D3K5_9BACT|nr:M23 family metallopeptidase [Thermosulfurimonas dismutans]OAQ20563.1 putative peptidase [Thermosulfurimonas dismutans]